MEKSKAEHKRGDLWDDKLQLLPRATVPRTSGGGRSTKFKQTRRLTRVDAYTT